jgi:hypothetical protein
MNKVARGAVAGLVLAGAGILPAAAAGLSFNIPFDQMEFQDLGGPKIATAWGDPTVGPHGSLLVLPAGFEGVFHTHTGTYWAVVVRGLISNVEEGQPEVPLGPGSFYVQEGGILHLTRCLTTEEDCLIYFTQEVGFDFAIPE